ncbi:hypothetical protein LLE87_05055 [Paenibacillus polymyxa]|nr:hypothetical protein [Paenibacillus polymyxa]
MCNSSLPSSYTFQSHLKSKW